MSGYFSQLARSTGLSIGRNRAGTMTSLAAAPAAASAREAAGLAVEEVALVAPPQTGSSLDLQHSDPGAASIDIDQRANPIHADENSATQRAPDDVSDAIGTNPGPGPAVDDKARQASLPEQSNVTAEPQLADTPKLVTAPTILVEQEIDPREVHDQSPESREASISLGPVERIQLIPRDVRTPAETLTSEPNIRATEFHEAVAPPANLNERTAPTASNEDFGARSDPARFARSQLSEVIAWVAANPTNVEELPLPEISIESHGVSGRDSGEHLQLDSLSPQPAHAPEIHDFSLSIGSINIVIDEPKQNAPALPTPPPITERPPAVADQPTDLSRYYLDRW